MRTSYMNEGISQAGLTTLKKDLDNASNYFEVCYILLGIIKSYSDTVREMQEKRAGKFHAMQYDNSMRAKESRESKIKSDAGTEAHKTKLPDLNSNSTKKKRVRRYKRQGQSKSVNRQKKGSHKVLEHHAVNNGGDILGHLSSIPKSRSEEAKNVAGKSGSYMSQEEAFAQIKGVDYSYKGRKKRNPSRPQGKAGGKSPRKAPGVLRRD